MKKLALFAAFLSFAAMPAYAYVADDLVALYRAQMDADLVKLDFSCAENFEQSATDELVKTLKQYWDDLRHDKEVPDDDIACRLRALVRRGHIEFDQTALYAYMFIKNRPGYAAYFFTALERERPHFADHELAELYARDGAQQDIPRATRMFRTTAAAHLFSDRTADECAAHSLSLRDEKLHTPLQDAQFEWAAGLCYKSKEEMMLLSETLSRSGDVNDKIVAYYVNRHLTSLRLHLKLLEIESAE